MPEPVAAGKRALDMAPKWPEYHSVSGERRLRRPRFTYTIAATLRPCNRMPKLNLTIPEQLRKPDDLGLDPRREGVERWLADLPLVNLDHSIDALLDMLKRVNSAQLAITQRHELLASLQPTVLALNDTLRDRFMRTLLPLPQRSRRHFESACELHRQLAIGYKLLWTTLLNQEPDRSSPILVESVHHFVHQLAMLLMEHYLIYSPEPGGLWRELHSTYRFAEQRGIGERSVRQKQGSATITALYKRAVLLSLANPFHLMQEEAFTVFRLLHKLAPGCDISLERSESHLACFLADLKTDSAPRFLAPGQDVTAAHPRYFTCHRLVQAIDQRISDLDDSNNETTRQLSRLARHMQRDMLTRLRDSWGRRSEREFERSTTLGRITIAMGLSATHYFCTEGVAFTPELDEIRIHTGRTPKGGTDPGLSLVPLDFEPWRAEEAETRLESGINEPRRSDFDVESSALDVWEKIYATRGKKDTDVADADGSLKPLYASTLWDVKNESEGGMCLACVAQRSLPVKVGDIVGYRREGDRKQWIIGAVRWLTVGAEGDMQMGVKRIADSARGVGTRAVLGAGHGGEYFRGLIAPARALNDREATLIVPATIYAQGTILAINLDHELHYLRLQELIESTKSFNRFRFREVPMPPSENKNIDALRNIL